VAGQRATEIVARPRASPRARDASPSRESCRFIVCAEAEADCSLRRCSVLSIPVTVDTEENVLSTSQRREPRLRKTPRSRSSRGRKGMLETRKHQSWGRSP